MAEVGKTQTIRLYDVFVLGPAMVYVGAKLVENPWARVFWIASGLGTIVYNAQNYQRQQLRGR